MWLNARDKCGLSLAILLREDTSYVLWLPSCNNIFYNYVVVSKIWYENRGFALLWFIPFFLLVFIWCFKCVFLPKIIRGFLLSLLDRFNLPWKYVVLSRHNDRAMSGPLGVLFNGVYEVYPLWFFERVSKRHVLFPFLSNWLNLSSFWFIYWGINETYSPCGCRLLVFGFISVFLHNVGILIIPGWFCEFTQDCRGVFLSQPITILQKNITALWFPLVLLKKRSGMWVWHSYWRLMVGVSSTKL